MGRKKQPSLLDEVFELLKLAPMWLGPVLAVATFAIFRYLFPLLVPAKEGTLDAGVFLRQMLPMLSWLAAGAVLMAWLAAEVWKLTNRRLLESQTGLPSIKTIPWRELERLVSEAYRRKGYIAEVIGSESGDGGVDIVLTRAGEKVLVQCKQWRANKVGVTTVRELLGVVVSQKATKGILVTSGRFTAETRRFAETNPTIELVNGPALFELIREVQKNTVSHPAEKVTSPAPVAPQTEQQPRCPLCGVEMVLRTARKGPNAGSQFWGCPKYPACRGTKPYSHSQPAPVPQQ